MPPLKRLPPVVGNALLNGLREILLDSRRMRITSVLLFGLTAASCYLAGGVRLAGAILAIVVAHEMGHFLACRYHGVPSTWPFLLPCPLFSPVGTLGALMIIQGRFPSRRALFDIGIAGPLAGLGVSIAVLGVGAGDVVFTPTTSIDPAQVLDLGTPILFRLLTDASPGPIPAGTTPFIGPLQLAGWFGLLLTGLNLIPIGQFDGGHVLYALFPRRAHRVARVVWYVCLALVLLAPMWLFWAILTHFLGRPHPPTLDDNQPLGWGRRTLGLLALVVFALTFIPEPILNSWETLFGDLRYLLP